MPAMPIVGDLVMAFGLASLVLGQVYLAWRSQRADGAIVALGWALSHGAMLWGPLRKRTDDDADMRHE